mgnify:CR=1 FL=1
MNHACLTINFQTKNVSIDGKAITLEGLINGLFNAEFNKAKQLWTIKNSFKVYGHTGNDIYVKQMATGLNFFIMLWTEEGHLVDSKIIKKLKPKLKLKIDHNSKVTIFETAWAEAYLNYDIRYNGITLVLEN